MSDMVERVNVELDNQCHRLIIEKQSDEHDQRIETGSRQYNNLYKDRLEKLRLPLIDWANENDVVLLPRLPDEVDVMENMEIALIGVLLKPSMRFDEEKKKKDTMNHDDFELETIREIESDFCMFSSSNVQLVLQTEDSNIRLTGDIDPRKYTTGLVVLVTGKMDEKDQLSVIQIVPPTPTFQKPIAESRGDRYLLLLSDLGFSNKMSEELTARLSCVIKRLTTVVADFPEGIRTARVVLMGNIFDESAEEQYKKWVHRTFRSCNNDEFLVNNYGEDSSHDGPEELEDVEGANMVVDGNNNPLERFDGWLSELSKFIKVDLSPGEKDSFLSRKFLPHHFGGLRLLFSKFYKHGNLRELSNPFIASYDGCLLYGMNNGIARTLKEEFDLSDDIDVANEVIKWGHFVPHSPEKIPCPPSERDPFVIQELPHVFFISSDSFNSKESILNVAGKDVIVQVIPSFKKSSCGVLFNIENMKMTKKYF